MKKIKPKNAYIPWQIPLALLLLAIGIAGFLWALHPASTETVILDLQEIRMPLENGQYAMLQQAYQMQIEAPTQAKAGKLFNYSFQLLRSENALNVTLEDVDIFDTYQLNLTLQPDFNNTLINPPGSMTTALLPEQEPIMLWKMEPVGKATIDGIFWIYLDFVPLTDDLPASSTALLARNVEIPVQTIFGFSTNWIAVISAAMVISAIFLGLPQLPPFRKETDDHPKK